MCQSSHDETSHEPIKGGKSIREPSVVSDPVGRMRTRQVEDLTDRKLNALWTSPEPSLERQIHLIRLKNFTDAYTSPRKRPPPPPEPKDQDFDAKRQKVDHEKVEDRALVMSKIEEAQILEKSNGQSTEEQVALALEDSGFFDSSFEDEQLFDDSLDEILRNIIYEDSEQGYLKGPDGHEEPFSLLDYHSEFEDDEDL
uniref:DUF2052 domain-containing protein n=1 Tax=Steinernema glaseri TaxID=37863 RepID=A0A1I8AH99_9BILA